MRTADPNRELLGRAVEQLGDLADELVFVGGCATGLLITDPAAAPIRATRDVDTIVEAASLAEYHRLAPRLRARGFSEDTAEDAPICRWRAPGVLLDVMPTRSEIIGFANRWYPDALRHAQVVPLPLQAGLRTIRLITAPYFLATKSEAFVDRGRGDYLGSHDLEDLVAVMDGRPEWIDEVRASDAALRDYLATRFEAWLADPPFLDALAGHLLEEVGNQVRVARLTAQLRALVAATRDGLNFELDPWLG